jgi:dienelactone hydrolase
MESAATTHEVAALSVAGVAEPVLTELVSAGAPMHAARVLVCVLPGNPGAAGFYETFVARIAAAAAAAAAASPSAAARGVRVACVGHASHHALSASPRALSLAQQVAHKEAFLLTALAAAPPGLRLVLVGHSVGAHMAVEAAASPRLPRGSVAGVAALFPTLLDIALTKRGRQLAPLFSLLGTFLVSSLAWLLRALTPRALLRRVASGFVGARAGATAVGLVHAHVAAAALVLARHEMAEITDVGGGARAAARALGSRLFCYFAPDDHWNRAGDAARVAELFPRAEVVLDAEGHSHSFVLRDASVNAMAAHVWRFVERTLDGPGAEGRGAYSAARRRGSVTD